MKTWRGGFVYDAGMFFELSDHFIVDADPDKTWAFFSAADNLPRITPPTLGFHIDTPMPVTMQRDVLLDYTIRWMGLPVRWRTRIIDWSPPHQFVDLQLRGPYTLWHHLHQFVAIGEGAGRATECFDRVTYKLPAGVIGTAMHAVVVRRQLIDIFRYRRTAIDHLLGKVRPVQADVQIKSL